MTRNWISPGSRVMDVAWLRDDKSGVIYTGEALVIACLLHAKGKTKRGREEIEQVAKMLNDPNVSKKNKRRKK